MAKITALPAVDEITGDEFLPVVQRGATKRTTMSALRALIVPYLQSWYKGDTGATGPAQSTYTTLPALRAAAVTNRSYNFAPGADDTSGFPAAPYYYTPGDFSGADYAADFARGAKVALDAVPLSTGALVRQRADGVSYGDESVSQALDVVMASGGVSVLRFIPPSLWAAIKAGEDTTDHTPYFRAAAIASMSTAASVVNLAVGTVFVPGGRYNITRVGIQGIAIIGESREGTVLRAASPGAPDDFLLDGMMHPITGAKTTEGTGWAENLSLEGTLPNGSRSGRSGLRTYGGGNAPRNLDIRNCNFGLACGLPIWQTNTNVYAEYCNVGFYTFHDAPRDNGTSTVFMACWALHCGTYGFHISQLYYSSFINCVSQEAGTHNFYLEGDLNGNAACYSLQFIGCATEGKGTPFYFRRGRDITVINPRVISPSATVNLVNFDDTTGSIMDFSTPGDPGPGKVHIWTNNSTPYSVALINSLVTYEAGAEGVFTRLGAGAVGSTAGGLSGSSLYVGAKKVIGTRGVPVSDIDTTGLSGAALTTANTVNELLARLRSSTGHGLIEG